MQIPGGWLAHKFGGFSILSFSMLVSGILTLLEPILITTGYAAFIICRILIGVAQGPIYPAMIEFWKEWSHPNDRARMVTTTEIGASIGTIFAMILPSVIVQRLNWSSPFYCFGIIGIAWPILWIAVSSRTPRSHNCSCMNEVSACMPEYNEIPWKLIFTSLPVYAYAIAFFCEGWILFTALTHIPKFLLLHREYDITHTGIKCIIPFIGQMIMLFISGFLSDLFISRDYLKPTIVRKGIYVIGNVISAACLITIGFLDDLNAALICLFTTIIIDGATRSVMLVNPLDLASPYAGFIMGIGHAACNLAGCICPLMAGHITESMAIERWRFVFGITAGISLLGAVAYIVGGSAEEIEGISSMNNKNKYKSLPTADSENVHLLQKENASPGINDK
ncbi:expressed hypothetical protein [Trichoplax adhaerens]|uniref:Major facilitator superfamily (MFS) profile domain-containing protein n=1 Tax=Trichoplax adhaerens TaxID=10228 RepID=B3RIH5_TRIAD|nr:expressed hypothetical protein [Trichoplax adhaerens]EDV29235.1 expressed hypothetical protein [Trichoplax adhaerens]|eukprot:XP_002108437.1 expressed hypothetical protein [Trichoplax adhaerens]